MSERLRLFGRGASFARFGGGEESLCDKRYHLSHIDDEAETPANLSLEHGQGLGR